MQAWLCARLLAALPPPARGGEAVIFFCADQPSPTASIFRSGMPYVARTFLPLSQGPEPCYLPAANRPAASSRKATKKMPDKGLPAPARKLQCYSLLSKPYGHSSLFILHSSYKRAATAIVITKSHVTLFTPCLPGGGIEPRKGLHDSHQSTVECSFVCSFVISPSRASISSIEGMVPSTFSG